MTQADITPDGGRTLLSSRIYAWFSGLDGPRAALIAFISGALANLAFAPVYLWPVMAMALVNLTWLLDGAMLRERPIRSAAFRGFWFAFGLFGVGFHWVAFAFLVNSSEHLAFVWLAFLLPIGLALIWALAIGIAGRFWCRGPARVMLLALCLFAAEWVRGHLFGGFSMEPARHDLGAGRIRFPNSPP